MAVDGYERVADPPMRLVAVVDERAANPPMGLVGRTDCVVETGLVGRDHQHCALPRVHPVGSIGWQNRRLPRLLPKFRRFKYNGVWKGGSGKGKGNKQPTDVGGGTIENGCYPKYGGQPRYARLRTLESAAVPAEEAKSDEPAKDPTEMSFDELFAMLD